MSKLVLDSTMVSRLSEFCDAGTLTDRIEVIGEVNGHLLEQLGEADDDDEKKQLTDWMLCLHDMSEDLKKIRRAQR